MTEQMLLISITIVALVIVTFIAYLKARSEKTDYNPERVVTLDSVTDIVKREIAIFINAPVQLRGSEEELNQALRRKANIENALTETIFGTASAKTVVIDLIRTILKQELPEVEDVTRVIDFNSKMLEPRIMFEVMMYFYRKEYHRDALVTWIKEFNLERERYIIEDGTKASYAITTEDVVNTFMKKDYELTYSEMIDVMSILVYQKYKGFGIIDTIREMNIDGFHFGTSGSIMTHLNETGVPAEFTAPRSIWLYLDGKFLHLRYLSFGSKDEVLRIVQLLSRYNRPGPLTERRGFIVNTMEDRSRITAVVPPVAEFPAAFIRKFTLGHVTTEGWVLRPKRIPTYTDEMWAELELDNRITTEELECLKSEIALLNDVGKGATTPTIFKLLINGINIPGYVKNGFLPIMFIKYIIMGQLNSAVTGRQGSGKTTLMTTLVKHMDPRHTIRILEMAFELYVREMYPERDIMTFQETQYVSASKIQDMMKKSDGAISMAGEVATDEVAARMIQFAQIASIYTLFTHHATTTESLVTGVRNHLAAAGNFDNMYVAERQVLEVLNIDVHLDYNVEGYRYIERITEIIPLAERELYPEIDPENIELSRAQIEKEFYYRQTDRKTFKTNDIIVYDPDKHAYKFVNLPSRELIDKMHSRMEASEREGFIDFIVENCRR